MIFVKTSVVFYVNICFGLFLYSLDGQMLMCWTRFKNEQVLHRLKTFI